MIHKGYKEYVFKGFKLYRDENDELKTSTEEIGFTVQVKGMSKREIEEEIARSSLNPKTVEVYLNRNYSTNIFDFKKSSFNKGFNKDFWKDM